MVNSLNYKNLILAAKKAREKAYAPYSRFRVGAAALTSSGKIFTGCNVENASYGLAICAERVAVSKAISEGEKKITAVAVFAGKGVRVSPCGACRQFICEFGPDINVVTISPAGKITAEKISSLLPGAFKL